MKPKETQAATTKFINLMLKVMINEFAQRRYKELYDEDI
jgi:hypothetical protein